MRALLALAAVMLLALPALPANPAPNAPQPVPEGSQALSHEQVAPYMHILALDIAKGIRPGAMLSFGPSNCTASFVVRDTAGNLYITSAGHCTHGIGGRVGIHEDTLVGELNGIREFGTVVAAWPGGVDSSLIRIDADKVGEVNPTMTGWGGPTGLYTGGPNGANVVVRQVGWGWATWLDQQTRCRTGIAAAGDIGSNFYWFHGEAAGGDSGSAVMTSDGQALGILDLAGTAIPVPGTTLFIGLQGGGPRFDAVLNAMRTYAGFDLTLVTGGPVNPVCLTEPALP
ncbi:MAG: S1 family peptidase [Halobacteriales archaeon]|nr:S1 family peptidase [Halobacteriales archaeon]